MAQQFSVGDHVRWNSEAGHVQGVIVEKHTRDVEFKGYTHHCSPDDPQYEIKSDKTDHIALHKGGALTKLF
ncbi:MULTISPECIES: DUF2945 domain-containing protein [Streptomyces]|uniref:Hypervirulence associated protein TUDOR domain-containing protein n=3 Tax=Streptomyces diastaticus group TaxID=2849069 RepID=A0A8H9HR96_9ACTN|nr:MULTISPECIES: DUF2945 domain-containing protein [Streptomyces]QNE82461.1 DUF2945 domain-containing protein [Streptomyces rutgersensis]WPR52416.1 DUF2945 domain-containing protein [Streptomyces sp. S399]GFH69853.1 hypothetical protein Sdia_06210 [Streptomyces diastaticus subsp. diastaticus]GFH78141.1 hypothetical protein Sgou_28110 [Streptomyces gougerotii]GGU20135.1 hypothetical protein GCM10015534_23800 [Streptomyces diastaticus subsp. diastaticus]